jgi:uncharacterized protein (DUF2147 family)
MKRVVANAALLLLALATAAPAIASAQSLEGKWANPKRSVIVKVARCGDAYCGTVSWATDRTKAKVEQNGRTLIGMEILTGLRPAGDGVYKGRAFEPKRNVRGSATVRQVGPNVMVVKGCAVFGMLCSEQRWTRVS